LELTTDPSDFNNNTLQDLVNDLRHDNFKPYATLAGGNRFGIISSCRPVNIHQSVAHRLMEAIGLATPIPDEYVLPQLDVPDSLAILRRSFRTITTSELVEWVNSQTGWLYA
jgi:hypothetical protein